MLSQFNTVLSEAAAEWVEKKSRFIAGVKPVATEEEARDFIEARKKEFWNATHNVFAYRIKEGVPTLTERYSDDGEPAGTAGMPILELLRQKEIINAVVVVTRYFGGTLLGTGGLVRAYGHSAQLGIDKACIITKMLFKQYKIESDYGLSGKIQYEILSHGSHILDTAYTDVVSYTILTRQEDTLKDRLDEISSGTVPMTWLQDVYGAFIEEALVLFE